MKADLTLPRLRNMEPLEFCRLYARKQEGEWGHKAQWRALLCYVLEVSDKTVQTWGPEFEKCPDRYKKDLARIHALKNAEKVLKAQGLSDDFFNFS